jgi:hypothetical protein
LIPKNGQNTVGFGSVNTNVRAHTCVWKTADPLPAEVTESDIRFNSNQAEQKFFATDSQPGTCVNLVDLEGVATHERGHTFAIDDIDATSHPDQTMAGSSDACDNLELRSLGKGDILGLNDMYNA